ncbi:MAG: sugar transferase, partial [Clostridioides difficile]|nr:sugar transferase [Clostridioides difficile]
PQLFNILKGDMGLIGPRPERPNFTVQFNEEIPGFINRLAIKPGLTGWAQVNGGYEITPEEKLKEDIYYIKNRSILLDFKILFKTVKVVLTGDGAR